MSSQDITRATDVGTVMSALVASFVSDPLQRWIYETPQAYFEGFPKFAAALLGPAFSHDMTWQTAGGSGVAIWLPPGVASNVDNIVEALESTVTEDRLGEAMEIGAEIGAAHPHEPHWYLVFLAVDPAHQNEGIGARLLKHGLEIVDQSGLPAYLESSNYKNVPFYERHGFEIVGEANMANAPSAYFLYRKARG